MRALVFDFVISILVMSQTVEAFLPHRSAGDVTSSLPSPISMKNRDHFCKEFDKFAIGIAFACALIVVDPSASLAAGDKKYDGFAEYAQENQMEKSDVKCFANQCGDQTKNLFSNPRGIKGVTCLGRCKGEQAW